MAESTTKNGNNALQLFPHVREQGITNLLERALAGAFIVHSVVLDAGPRFVAYSVGGSVRQ